MRTLRALLITAVVFAALAGVPSTASAAESYDNCIGFIDALPTVITTQGTFCLRQDLTTSAVSGNMISIQTNNVTIDCNGFKLGGASGGTLTAAIGIFASNQQHITVRHCTIRGFFRGIDIEGSGNGHLIEDNALDQNTDTAIYLTAEGGIVQRNRVMNTGGKPGASTATGIRAVAHIIDNVVDGITGTGISGGSTFNPTGIWAGSGTTPVSAGLLIRQNRVRNLVAQGDAGRGIGILLDGAAVYVRDNIVSAPVPSGSAGSAIACNNTPGHVRDNLTAYYTNDFFNCGADALNNFHEP